MGVDKGDPAGRGLVQPRARDARSDRLDDAQPLFASDEVKLVRQTKAVGNDAQASSLHDGDISVAHLLMCSFA